MKHLLFSMALIGITNKAWSKPKAREISVDFGKALSHRDPLIPGKRDWVGQANFNLDLDLHKYIFFDNNIHMEQEESGKIRTAGWQYELGIRPLSWLHLFHHHHSRHVFDQPLTIQDDFPVSDFVGIRIYFVGDR